MPSKPPDVEEVLVGSARVRVTFHSEIFDQADRLYRRLAEFMFAACLNAEHTPVGMRVPCVDGSELARAFFT